MKVNDQADKLRDIIHNLRMRQEVALSEEKKHCRVITVTSGKGGVGKTNISVNLALVLSQLGYKVVILDADFGLANIDILLGVSPRYTLLDVVYHDKTILDILCKGPEGIQLISGGSGIKQMIDMDSAKIDILIKKMACLDEVADILIVDTGAGVSDNVTNFVYAADDVILVTTPEPTSIMDAYALIKTVFGAGEKVNMHVIVNRAESYKEATQIGEKLCLAADKFLGTKVKPLGYVLNDQAVVKAVKQQQPFVLSFPSSNVAKQITEIGYHLANKQNELKDKYLGVKGFLGKLTCFIKV